MGRDRRNRRRVNDRKIAVIPEQSPLGVRVTAGACRDTTQCAGNTYGVSIHSRALHFALRTKRFVVLLVEKDQFDSNITVLYCGDRLG